MSKAPPKPDSQEEFQCAHGRYMGSWATASWFKGAIYVTTKRVNRDYTVDKASVALGDVAQAMRLRDLLSNAIDASVAAQAREGGAGA